jgi:PKD repeat protein
MTRKLISALAATAAIALIAAVPATAEVIVEGTGEPAFTNTTTNTQYVRWQNAQYDAYRLTYLYLDDNVQRSAFTSGNVNVNGGTGWANWAGVVNGLQEGHVYGICVGGERLLSGMWFPDAGGGSCANASIAGKRAHTTIDRTGPQISVSVNGADEYARSPALQYRIDYADNLAFPFPANWVCTQVGGDPATACAGAGALQYAAGCSTPANPSARVTHFTCSQDLSASPDGKVIFCAVSADGAIPDNPVSANQGATADRANRSGKACGWVILDRAAPSVTAGASATSVHVGDLVSFDASASDATSGLTGAYEWSWGDNTPGATGATATHTYMQPGTYSVALRTADKAGNTGTATKLITVTPRPVTPPPGGGDGGTGDGGTTPPPSGGGGGTATPPATDGGTVTPPTGGAVTPAPTAQQVSQSAGGGGTQAAAIAGLDVLAPRKVRLAKSTKRLALALTAEGPGTVAIALVRGGRVVAQGATAIGAPGTLGFKLTLPRGLKAGRYHLKVAFTASGAPKASTKTIRLTFAAAGRKARRATAAIASAAAQLSGTTPVSLPDGSKPDPVPAVVRHRPLVAAE